jgi:hypothetical protein
VLALRGAALVSLLAVLLLFPAGSSRPRAAWAAIAAFAVYLAAGVASPAPPTAFSEAAALPLPAQAGQAAAAAPAWHALVVAIVLGGGLALLARRVPRLPPVPRQQAKWVLFGACAAVLSAAALELPVRALNPGRMPGLLAILYTLASVPAAALALLLWPLGLNRAALRRWLWDVDFATRSALIYGPLLAALALVMGASLWALSRAAPSEPLVTFMVAAVLAGLLFQPVRGALQGVVDRRLYGLRSPFRARVPVPAEFELAQGRLGRFARLQPITLTEFGQSYRALHPENQRPVTVNVLPPLPGGAAAAFEPAMTLACHMNHPHLARLYEWGEADRRFYTISEYVVGQDLGSFLLINGRLALDRALPILRDLAAGLDALHGRGGVHGDVRLANVLLVLRDGERIQRDARFAARVAFLPNTAFRPVLLHVGLALALGTGLRRDALGYAAPEVIGGAPPTPASDRYAFGALAYLLLAGVLPFQHPHPAGLALAHRLHPPPDPRARVHNFPAPAAQALLRALSKAPEARFASAGELVAALESDAVKVPTE